jgi:hypothetical protein
MHAHPRAVVAHLREQAAERGSISDQDDLGRPQRERRFRSTLHDLVGSMIAPHGVDDDAVHGRHLATQTRR